VSAADHRLSSPVSRLLFSLLTEAGGTCDVREWPPTIYRKIREYPQPASDQAQARADGERAMAMYQQPPARFSAAITRKNAAHP
jgi:hypothetical protein